MKSKSSHNSNGMEHSYAVKHPFDKVKVRREIHIDFTANFMNISEFVSFRLKQVKLDRMSEKFVAEQLAEPRMKSTNSNHKHHESQSPSTTSKRPKAGHSSDTVNSLKQSGLAVASTSPRVNGKNTKTKEIGNADATTSIHRDSPKKGSSTNPSSDSPQKLSGTPVKHKLADRTNGNDVAKAFSPRKTRSKVSQIPTDTAAGGKAKTKLMLPQSAGKLKKSNIETLNINVAALLAGAKRANPVEETDGNNGFGYDDIPPTERLVDLNRNRAKHLSRRPPNRAGQKQGDDGLKANVKLKLPQLDGANDVNNKKAKAKTKAESRPKPKDDSNSDSDFEPAPQKRVCPKITPVKPVNKNLAKAKKIDNRVFSTDEEHVDDADANTLKMNFWVEAYAEKEKKWITIDPAKKKVDCADYVRVRD